MSSLRGHLAYFKYLLRHKWFVLLGCRKVGLSWRRAILHDWSKFLPREWLAYRKNFFNDDGTRKNIRDASGAYDPTKVGEAFDLAWLSHQRNKHHWQAWISIGDFGILKPLEIPEVFVREAIADWIGAGMAIMGRDNPRPWYEANKHKMKLHENTRALLEKLLSEYFPT